MVVDEGEHIHVIERRAFDSDVRRHFAGRVDRVDGSLARVTGYLYAFDARVRVFHQRSSERTRIIALGDARLIVNVLPPEVRPGDLVYRWTQDEQLLVSHSSGWTLDLSEFVWSST